MRAARRTRAASTPSAAEPTSPTTAPPPAAPTPSAGPDPAVDFEASPIHDETGKDADLPKTITGVAAKLVETRRQLRNWTEKTAGQHVSVASLLARIVQHDDFARLRQGDFARYRDVLLGLPKVYGRSSKDAQRSVAELLARGRALPPEERGLIGPTINRHLTQLGNILEFAAS